MSVLESQLVMSGLISHLTGLATAQARHKGAGGDLSQAAACPKRSPMPSSAQRRTRSARSPHIRDQSLASLRVRLLELFSVPLVVLHSPWADIERCRRREDDSRRSTATRKGEATPLDDLAEKVGAAHPSEHAAVGDLVPCLTGAAQVAQHMVRVDVDASAKDHQTHAHEKAGRAQPLGRERVEFGQVAALQITIAHTEGEGKEGNTKRCGLAAADGEREDDAPVEVVGAKERQQ
eukprot:CAMPEP_0181225030 /NCGR_PEP_ID=MMETSP1096-20121128/31464_1 /TAXON_ID=156174 ORGANISM="Chrysochromulina ericina, Strain CCMP281" /NCGR_SAMPLE_ID=MMETSP1096 /ASSEMBLY_ACC=CAM_ASM_000453 /LENGTH=234 /DNA_ID=CAMNT_0023318195 /DNA_START=32 /DNA_END=734 /DNA_ORIENTATION=+